MSASVTNATTNGLHAAFLLLYFLGAAHGHRCGRGGFTRLVVGLFALLFALKLIGVYVHYYPPGDAVRIAWGVISTLAILLNYIVLQVAGAPRPACVGGALVTAASALGFVVSDGDFTFLALPSGLVCLAAAYYAGGLLRVGLLLVVASNLVWIAARKITELAMGGKVPIEYRYDNDAYHFLLIASTFVIYKSFERPVLRARSS